MIMYKPCGAMLCRACIVPLIGYNAGSHGRIIEYVMWTCVPVGCKSLFGFDTGCVEVDFYEFGAS